MVITLEQCVPFAIVLIALIIELTPAHFLYTGPFVTASPALAAVTMGPRGTMAAGAFALTISVITATYNEAWGSDQVYSNLLGLLLVSAASVTTSSAVRTRRQSELDQIRRIASAAQEVILRPVPARLGPLRAASTYLAAETGAQIGGDLYEAVHTHYGVRLIVGDVRGKGLHAVRAAAAVLSAFREAVHYEDDLAEVVDHCAAALRREGAVTGAVDHDVRAEEFVTVLVAQVPESFVVQLVNRGHPPPLVLSNGKVRPLLPTSPLPPLGLEDVYSSPSAEVESHSFAPGDRLLLYTDGVIEARDRDNNFFPLAEAMAAVRPSTPLAFLDELHDRLMRHTEGSLADDVAMVVADRLEDDHGARPSTLT
ncbi:PP2C family protein-serine/threonine phosphatase [Streptomyces sp. NA02950]|uniref:PP2C family protein-serine/threonine phosphatase n=1 Tax=Streptomyces sp. NA02950 TaxID=2742137 RepID=UPI0020CB3129|nr:PP2C family protein-serine/threonine phosphatase [Streptomyces sp. NA02950]